MSKTPFPMQPELTAIAKLYRNENFIADEVMPRVPVGTEEFKYLSYNKNERFTIPDTHVGRKGQPNEVEFGATELTSSTKDYGLEAPVPQKDIDNAPRNYDPLGVATMNIMELVELDREKRVADLVFSAATYPSGNKTTLAGTNQWNDFTNSDPLKDIMDAFDAMMARPNIAIFGQAVFSTLRRHPDIAKAVHGNSGDTAIVARRQIAELLELEEVFVGAAWYNSAKPGQTATFARLWGKHAAFLHRNRAANTQAGVTFGLTAQFGDRVAGSAPDRNIGLRGGTRVRAGESVDELIVASDTGYMFENAVA